MDTAFVLTGALMINLLVFGTASVLQRSARVPILDTEYRVSAFLPERIKTPPRQEEEPPPEEKPPPKIRPREIRPANAKTTPLRLKVPSLDIEVNPKLTMGVDLGPVAMTPLDKSEYVLGEVDRAPLVTAQVPPIYPYHAKRMGVEGSVVVRFLISLNGEVSRISVTRSTPPGVFDEAVVQSLSRWRFSPGIKDGEPVDTWMETEIEFELEKK